MHLSLLAILIFTLFAATGQCKTIINSKHDFRSTTGAIGICEFCHKAHDNRLYEALWTKDPTHFRLYSGINTASKIFKTGLTPDSKSLICMACHDGSTVGVPPHQLNIPLGDTNFGNNLTGSHPINFQVTANNTQNDLWVEGGAYTGNKMGRIISKPYPLYLVSGTGDRCGSRALECSSCHDIHDTTHSPFLRETMDQSKLCLDCHNK